MTRRKEAHSRGKAMKPQAILYCTFIFILAGFFKNILEFHFENGTFGSGKRVALLLSFPGSGDSIVVDLLEEGKDVSVSNVGAKAYIVGRHPDKLILARYFFKPYQANDFLLSKTECTRSSYEYNYFLSSNLRESEFYESCLRQYSSSSDDFYDSEVIKSLIHFYRHPIDNIVSRYIQDYNKNPLKYRNIVEGATFQSFCSMRDAEFYNGRNQIFDFPCSSDFQRYVQWHNIVNRLEKKLKMSTFSVYYFEDLIEKKNSPDNTIFNDFLKVFMKEENTKLKDLYQDMPEDIRHKSEDKYLNGIKTSKKEFFFQNFFTAEHEREIWQLIGYFATDVTMAQLKKKYEVKNSYEKKNVVVEGLKNVTRKIRKEKNWVEDMEDDLKRKQKRKIEIISINKDENKNRIEKNREDLRNRIKKITMVNKDTKRIDRKEIIRTTIRRKNIFCPLEPFTKVKQIEVTNHINSIDFSHVDTYVMFWGFPRSGHSWIGSVLDASPNAMIANEFDAFHKFQDHILPNHKLPNEKKSQKKLPVTKFKREELFWNLSRNSYLCGKYGRMQVYNYTIPGLWQGKVANDTVLKVIGDKKGDYSTRSLMSVGSAPWENEEHANDQKKLFNSFSDMIAVQNLRMIVVLRNPFNMIATQFTRRQDKGTREREIRRRRHRGHPRFDDSRKYDTTVDLKLINENLSKIKQNIWATKNLGRPEQWFVFTMEEFANNTQTKLQELCNFTTIQCPSVLITKVVNQTNHKPSETWMNVKWEPDHVLLINNFIQENLADYYSPLSIA